MLQSRQILQDRYQLQRLLGQNAGRETWLAEDKQAQTPVVVKLLTFSDRVQWDQLRLFEREAQILKQLTHPQIPQYHDFFCLDDRLLWFGLVQSYVPGRSLKQLLEQGKVFDESEVRQIAEQILQILIYLHGLSPPVLHRDIKPSNLILNEAGKVHLVDFGAVQDRVAKAGATFTVVGTYGYAPLEQLGGRATPASDLYALGATLIHLLTGVAPANLPQANGRLQFGEMVNLNPGFVRWLWRLTEVNAELRYPTAHAALQALQTNQAAISGNVATKPKTNRLQLQKSPQQLEISTNNLFSLVRARREVVLALVSLGFTCLVPFVSEVGFLAQLQGLLLLLWRGNLPLTLWFGIRSTRIIPKIIGKSYITRAHFDSQHFEICWSFLGFSRRKKGRITDIAQVSKGVLQGPSKIFPAVKITVGVHEYLITSIDPPLAEAERNWLLQEMRQWFGLEST